MSLSQQRIGQLDGVDDGSESDASVSTNPTPTTAAAAAHRPSGKRRGRDRHANKQEQEAGKEAETTSRGAAGGGSSNSRDSRKSQKDNCLPLGAVKSQGGSQGQDPLEAQLSLSTDLLKSDSDNNNSDDCGNILPSDIMEFVLNTPSMQAMGQQAEPSSSDILFEDFPQPLAGAEPVEGGVAGVEEPYGLPLELPSDLSVLTTRSPTVNSSQNQPALLSDGPDRSMLALSSNPDGLPGGKGGDKKRGGAGVSPDSQSDAGSRESQVTEGHMTPEHFIPSPAIGQVVDGGGNQDVTRSSGTPGLPSSPSLPLQGQKYLPATANPSPGPCPNPGPSQAPSPTVHTSSPHLKPGPEKLIVVNQHLQPLYVLQTLANGVTQKIQIAPSVSATGVMDTSSSVLSSMTLTTGLSSSGLTTSQSLFPAGGKVLGTMPHHSHIHTFTGTTQTGFQTGIPSTTSGLLIGVPSQAHDPHILVTEAGRPPDIRPNVAIVSSPSSIAPSPAILASAHGKKRPISRLQPRKTKKLARSRSQPTLAPSEVGHSNMTLINLSSPQITAGIPAQPGSLVELGTLTPANASSHRKVPNIIKRPKTGGLMYFGGPQGGILGPDPSTHLLPCTVASLNPNQSVLNVVSMPSSAASGLLGPGSVSLSTPILSTSDITGPISNLLFKAGPHGLGLSDQPMVLQSGGGAMMSQLGSGVQTSIACVLPSHQTFSMAVTHQGETESSITHAHHLDPGPPAQGPISLAPAPSPVSMDPAKGRVLGVFTHQTPPSQSSRTTAISRASESRLELRTPSRTPSTGGPTAGKSKQKAKRSRQSPEKTSGKKLKSWQADASKDNMRDPITGSRDPISPEPMETGRPSDRGTNKSVYGPRRAEAPPSLSGRATEERGRTSGSAGLQTQGGAGGSGSLLVVSPPDQRGGGRDSLMEAKPKKGLIFEICSDDGFHIRCESIEEAWKSLTDKVQEARSNARLKELSFEGVNGLRMLGVVHDAVVFLLEQLHGSRHCRNYRFRFHKPEEPHPLPLNPHGAARAELHHRRSVFDMFNFLASKHRQPPEYNPLEDADEEGAIKAARRSSSVDLPLVQRFRQLKASSRQSVGVYRSPIHGRGLFCKKTIEAGEMVIEYSGNVIRSVLTDKREKLYDSKGIGCYMFRIDDYEVVDATVHGNAARFINHSCEPNCHSRVLSVDGQKHIVIFSSRRVYRGEELTYDYKFPTEEPANKLPCNCGTKKCRKFLN